MPQGSVLGPILFCLYISPIADIVSQYGVSLQQYADDTQLYIACSVDDAASALSVLESCLTSLHSWFCHNGLALNPAKSEAILLGTRQRLSSFPIPVGIQTANSSVHIYDHITTVGVTLDSNLTLNGHVFVLFVIRNSNLYLSLRQLSVSSLLSVLHIVILYFTVNL